MKSAQLQQTIPVGTDAFERVFLQTVLLLRGVAGTPTPKQYADLIETLDRYRIRVAQAKERDLAADNDWLRGSLQEHLAVERAFLFVRFDSVLRKTELQNHALHGWLRSCRFTSESPYIGRGRPAGAGATPFPDDSAMDKIIALFAAPPSAERARVSLGREGFAADRLDVVSLADQGRVVEHSPRSPETDLIAHFSVLLADDDDLPVVEGIVSAIQHGKAALVVHPRGKVEVEQAQKIIAAHQPETVLWRVAPPNAQGGLLGEHAAGFKP